MIDNPKIEYYVLTGAWQGESSIIIKEAYEEGWYDYRWFKNVTILRRPVEKVD